MDYAQETEERMYSLQNLEGVQGHGLGHGRIWLSSAFEVYKRRCHRQDQTRSEKQEGQSGMNYILYIYNKFFGKKKELEKENELLKKQLELRDKMLSDAVRKLEKYVPDEKPPALEGKEAVFVRGYFRQIKRGD